MPTFSIPVNWRDLDEEIRATGWPSNGALSAALWRRHHPEVARRAQREKYLRGRRLLTPEERATRYARLAETLRARHGEDYYRRLGQSGGASARRREGAA